MTSLATPNGLSVQSTYNGLCLKASWTPVCNVTGYKLFRSEVPYGDFSLVATLAYPTGLTFFDQPQTPNDNWDLRWYYEVASTMGSTISALSGPTTYVNYSAFDNKPIPGASWTTLF